MNKHDDLRILFAILTGTLPYEYDEKLINNGTTIVITKEESDYTMYISLDETNSDDFIVEVTCNDLDKGTHKEYETFHWIAEDEQIPLATIIADIKQYL